MGGGATRRPDPIAVVSTCDTEPVVDPRIEALLDRTPDPLAWIELCPVAITRPPALPSSQGWT